MNLFGAFNFGSIIKTFLPGITLFFVLSLYLELLFHLVNHPLHIFEFYGENTGLLTLIAIPVSIMLGVTLNSVVFSGLSNFLLEKRHKQQNAEFFALRKAMNEKINRHMAARFDLDTEQTAQIADHLDPRYLLLHKMKLDNLMYLRESYWYFFEFQLNSLVAVTIAMPAFIGYLIFLATAKTITVPLMIGILVVMLLLWYGFYRLFIQSAYDNLDRHRKKELSLLMGVAYFELQDMHEAEKT